MAAIAIPIVGWFVVPYINDFIKKAYSVLTEDIKSNLRDLETKTLPELKAKVVAGEMEEQSIGLLAELVMEFKDAAYEVEDFVDKIEYKRLAREAMGTMDKIVSIPASAPSSVISVFNKSSTLEQLENKISRLKQFYEATITNRRVGGPAVALRPTSTSELTERPLGRETETRDIKKFRRESVNNGKPFKVAAIIGVGGVGKTILAQELYNDPDLGGHFRFKMWVHVSEKWDAIKMTKTMIQLAHAAPAAPAAPEAPAAPGHAVINSDDLQVLQTELRRRIAGNTFLLVLDDVWYNDQLNVRQENPIVHHVDRWRELCAPLSSCSQGSMILITTRMKTAVPSIFGRTGQFFLKGLKLEQCRDVFDRHAFAAGGPDQGAYNRRLTTIASKIVTQIIKKLEGLPSAAREAGLMLEDERRKVNFDIEAYHCKIKLNILNDTRNTLMWSYRMLRQELKPCFTHLSLYPQGFKFNRTFLTLSWIGVGVITLEEGNEKTLEEMGHEYFDGLVSRSFFERIDDAFFILHRPLHALAEFIAKKECMRIIDNEVRTIPPTIKHLSIDAQILDQYKDNICSLEKLRTLFVTCNNTNVPIVNHKILGSILKKTKRLRALRLSSDRIDKLPDSVGRSKHLRFLDLSKSAVNELPESVCKVYHLWYLDLNNGKLKTVHKGLNKLINLQYLVSDGTTLSKIPHIGKLTLLRELKEFHVKKEEGHDLGQLKNMDRLQGALRILNLDAVSSARDAEEAKLQEKSGLREFVQEWSHGRADRKHKNWLRFLSKTSTPPTDQEVLDKLQPPGNITKLTIRGYAGSKTPVWMHDNNCRNSHLQTLVLDNCSNLQGNDAVLLPKSLVDLKITDCSISDNHLSGCLTGLNKLTSLELHQCADVTTLPQEEVLKHLTSLKSVSIHNCDNLVSLGGLQILAPPPFEASRPLRRLSIQNRNGRLPQPLPDNLRSLM